LTRWQVSPDDKPHRYRIDNKNCTIHTLEIYLHRYTNETNNIAQSKKVSTAQVALAWVLSQNDEIISIPGTKKIQRLEENVGAYKVELTEADLALIQKSMPAETIGNRY
jgi:aryl-alcohol dehydrogenase-like predicted oxidoreductase